MRKRKKYLEAAIASTRALEIHNGGFLLTNTTLCRPHLRSKSIFIVDINCIILLRREARRSRENWPPQSIDIYHHVFTHISVFFFTKKQLDKNRGRGVFIAWRVSYLVLDLRAEQSGEKLAETPRTCGEDRMFFKKIFPVK